jgi:hypothetical protein
MIWKYALKQEGRIRLAWSGYEFLECPRRLNHGCHYPSRVPEFKLKRTKRQARHVLALTETCKQIHTETTEIFYIINKFQFILEAMDEVAGLLDESDILVEGSQYSEFMGVKGWIDRISNANAAQLRHIDFSFGTVEVRSIRKKKMAFLQNHVIAQVANIVKNCPSKYTAWTISLEVDSDLDTDCHDGADLGPIQFKRISLDSPAITISRVGRRKLKDITHSAKGLHDYLAALEELKKLCRCIRRFAEGMDRAIREE